MPVLPADVPVEPTPPEAAQWLAEELAKAEYQSAKPTLIDIIAKAISDWFSSLQFVGLPVPSGVGLAIVVSLLAVAVLVLVLVFGRPRLRRRSAETGALFGEDDARSAEQLRRDAEAAARRGDWVSAIADRFRALARAVADREIVPVLPGTTAHEFARSAAAPFPAEAEALGDAAIAFDEVRYLSRPGGPEAYQSLVALDDRIAAARPARDLVAAGAAMEPPR